jgi:hypothetical protein
MPFVRLTHKYENQVTILCLNFSISWRTGVLCYVFGVVFSICFLIKEMPISCTTLFCASVWTGTFNHVSFVVCRYDDTGFKINNVKYEGSLLIVENKIMTWAPKTFSEITAER